MLSDTKLFCKIVLFCTFYIQNLLKFEHDAARDAQHDSGGDTTILRHFFFRPIFSNGSEGTESKINIAVSQLDYILYTRTHKVQVQVNEDEVWAKTSIKYI